MKKEKAKKVTKIKANSYQNLISEKVMLEDNIKLARVMLSHVEHYKNIHLEDEETITSIEMYQHFILNEIFDFEDQLIQIKNELILKKKLKTKTRKGKKNERNYNKTNK